MVSQVLAPFFFKPGFFAFISHKVLSIFSTEKKMTCRQAKAYIDDDTDQNLVGCVSVSVLVLKMWRGASYMNHFTFSPCHGLMPFFFKINFPLLWNQVVSSHN